MVMEVLCWTRSIPFPWAGTVELFEVPSERRLRYNIKIVLMPPVATVLHSFL